MLQHLSPLFVGLVDGFRAALVHEDVPCALACFAYQRHVAQRLLHHPAEAASQKTVDEEDVVHALMVGHEDVGLLLVEQLAPLHLDGQQEAPAHQPAPHHRRVVAPEAGFAQCAADDGDEGCNNRHNQQQGCGDEELIESVEYLHGISSSSLSPCSPLLS